MVEFDVHGNLVRFIFPQQWCAPTDDATFFQSGVNLEQMQFGRSNGWLPDSVLLMWTEMAMLGEDGISLSSAQRQCIARAVNVLLAIKPPAIVDASRQRKGKDYVAALSAMLDEKSLAEWTSDVKEPDSNLKPEQAFLPMRNFRASLLKTAKLSAQHSFAARFRFEAVLFARPILFRMHISSVEFDELVSVLHPDIHSKKEQVCWAYLQAPPPARGNFFLRHHILQDFGANCLSSRIWFTFSVYQSNAPGDDQMFFGWQTHALLAEDQFNDRVVATRSAVAPTTANQQEEPKSIVSLDVRGNQSFMVNMAPIRCLNMEVVSTNAVDLSRIGPLGMEFEMACNFSRCHGFGRFFSTGRPVSFGSLIGELETLKTFFFFFFFFFLRNLIFFIIFFFFFPIKKREIAV